MTETSDLLLSTVCVLAEFSVYLDSMALIFVVYIRFRRVICILKLHATGFNLKAKSFLNFTF